jgi:hypothetical protein
VGGWGGTDYDPLWILLSNIIICLCRDECSITCRLLNIRIEERSSIIGDFNGGSKHELGKSMDFRDVTPPSSG